MAEKTEKEEQTTPGIELLQKRLDALQSGFFFVTETVKELFILMETIADERKKHELQLLKEMYETQLREQYNTFKFDGHLEYHREYSDKKLNTNKYIIEGVGNNETTTQNTEK